MILLFSYLNLLFPTHFSATRTGVGVCYFVYTEDGNGNIKSIDNIRKSLFLDGRFDRTELEFLS